MLSVLPVGSEDSCLAAQALAQSPLPALRRVEVEIRSDLVFLRGKLPSYYFKQLAQETVMPTLGGRRLVNRIEVVREISISTLGDTTPSS